MTHVLPAGVFLMADGMALGELHIGPHRLKNINLIQKIKA